jgi:RHS repeat-associated protein
MKQIGRSTAIVRARCVVERACAAVSFVTILICAGSAAAMPPGWTRGCINPIYGSAEAACATGLSSTVPTFTFDAQRGICTFIGTGGGPLGQQNLCQACPTGFALDAQANCARTNNFTGPDPYANAGIDVQPALGANGPTRDAIMVAGSIHAQTGNFYRRELDFQGAGSFPLVFERHYNSQFVYASPLGLNWRHSYDRQILPEDATHVAVVRPNGQAFYFALANGRWSSTTDLVDRLQSTGTGWQLITQADETETYDASGRLVTITNRAGLTQTLTYSTVATPPGIAPAPGLLLSVADPAGRRLSFTYTIRRALGTMTDPAGNVYRYTYDLDAEPQQRVSRLGLLLSVAYPGTPAPLRTYVYQFANQRPVLATALTDIRDENGDSLMSLTYDVSNARTVTSQRGGALAADPLSLRYTNPPVAAPTTNVIDARTTRGYTFQLVRGLSRLTSVTQPCAGCTSPFAARSYDANGYPVSETDYNGNVTLFQRTDASRPDLETVRIEAAGTPVSRTVTTQWHPTFRLPLRIAEPLRITTLAYDDHGNVTSRSIQPTSDASGALGFDAPAAGTPRTWTYTYTYGAIPGSILRMMIDGPRTDVADVTTYDYDGAGNLAAITDALGHVTTFIVDAVGRTQQIVDPNGMSTVLTYDARGRLVARDAGAQRTLYGYDAAGQLKTVAQGDGSTLTYMYDAAHRITQIQDSLNNRVVYTLDALGNRVQRQVVDASGALSRASTREFDALSRLITLIGGSDPASQITRIAYDAQGNRLSVTDPLGHATSGLYDALNRLVTLSAPPAISGSVGGATQIAYDALDRITQVTDARGIATAYTLDGTGNLTRVASQDAGLSSSAFDAAGNLVQRMDARGVIGTFSYDPLGRITQALYTPPAGAAIAPVALGFGYDDGPFAIGRLSSVSDPGGSTAYQYDSVGRVIAETRTIAGVAYATGYRYDAAGRLSRLTYPSGRTLDYTRDIAGRVIQIDTASRGSAQTLVSNVTWQPFGNSTGFILGNGQAVSRPADLDGRVTSYNAGTVARAVAYDAGSRVVAYRHANAQLDQTFLYDGLDRLAGWSSAGSAQSFAYDASGNRSSFSMNGTTYQSSIDPASNRLIAVEFPNAFACRTDEIGNTTQDVLHGYSYDARGRLTQIVTGGVVTRVAYNAWGQRVLKAVDRQIARVFHYDLTGRLIAESNVAGEVLREYVYLDDLPVALLSSDHDDDGVPDARDNCVYDANPDQTDTSASGYGNVCNGDANGDGVVNDADLNLAVLLAHRPGGSATPAGKRADMNGDGVLNYQDQALITQWIRTRGVPGPSGLRGQVAGPEVFYIHADQTGAPIALIDAQGKVRWQRSGGDPFGIQAPDESPQGDFISLPFHLRFNGQYLDRESGLHSAGARDYDPALGRFLEMDATAPLDPYSFAGSNPANAVRKAAGEDVGLRVPRLPVSGAPELSAQPR